MDLPITLSPQVEWEVVTTLDASSIIDLVEQYVSPFVPSYMCEVLQ